VTRHDLEPLAREMAELLAAERRAPPPAAERQQRILSRVEAAVGIGAGVAAASAGAQAAVSVGPAAALTAAGTKTAAGLAVPLSKVWLAVVTLSAIGVGAGAALYQRADHRSAAPAIGAGGGLAAAGPAPARAVAAGPAPPAVAPAARAASAVAPRRLGPAPAGAPGDIVAESALLEAARRALVDGDARVALGRIAQHVRQFQRGLLVEERDALWIQALALAGERGAARARAAAFYRRFPDSIQRDAIERALATSTESRRRGQ